MKKFICLIVVLLAAVILYSPDILAQDQVDTVWLSVNSDNRILVRPDTVKVNEQGRIVFCTNKGEKFTFTVIIDNYDHFFDYPATPLIFNVSDDSSVPITVGSPPEDNNIKVYSVGTVGKKVPLPPASPPRIILNRQ